MCTREQNVGVHNMYIAIAIFRSPGVALLVPLLTDEEERGVHDRGTVKHGSHENVVPWAVHERHMAKQRPLPPVRLEHILLPR